MVKESNRWKTTHKQESDDAQANLNRLSDSGVNDDISVCVSSEAKHTNDLFLDAVRVLQLTVLPPTNSHPSDFLADRLRFN